MNKSETLAKLSTALSKAQHKIGGAHKGSSNPFFKSKFADLGSVMEACKEPLLENGITVLQLVGHNEHGDYLETVILHESGEWISGQMRLVYSKQNDPQSQGSAISYARRYALQSALFIPAVDDDAERATDRTPEAAKPAFNKPIPYAGEPGDFVCHKGKETKGKKVKELTEDQARFFATDFKPVTDQDKELQAACDKFITVPF